MGSAEKIAGDIRDYCAAGIDTMNFDVRRPSMTETFKGMEWMAKEVFTRV